LTVLSIYIDRFTATANLPAFAHRATSFFSLYLLRPSLAILCLLTGRTTNEHITNMRQVPPEVLVTFPPPNYLTPVTHGNSLVLVISIFLALVVLAVGLRFYTRIIIKKGFGSDDIFIGLALVSFRII